MSGLAIQRQALQERLVEVRAQVVELNLTVSPSTSCLRVAGEDRGCGPFNVPIFAAAGEILLEVEAPGHRPEKRLLDQAPGSRVEVDLALRPFPASEESATPSISASGTASSDRPNDETAATLLPAWPAFVVAGIALAALGTGAGLSVVANTKEEDAAERLAELRNASDRASPCAPPQADTASCEAIASALQSHDTLTNAGTGLIVSGVGVLAVAGVMYGLSWVESDRDDGAAWMVVPQLAAARDATVVGLGALGAW